MDERTSSDGATGRDARARLRYPFDVDGLYIERRRIRGSLGAVESPVPVRIAILGGSTTCDLRAILEVFLQAAGFEPEIYESDYGQFYDDAVLGNAALAAFRPTVAVVFTSVRNVRAWPQALATAEQVDACVEEEMGRYRRVWGALATAFGCVVVQNNFDPPPERPLGALDGTLEFGRASFVARLNAELAREARARTDLVVHDIHALASNLGQARWHDRTSWYGLKVAMSREGVVRAAHGIAGVVGALHGKTRKCLVLDLDNTLWGGVIGDDGLAGLKLGVDDALGEAYVDFQRYCLDLRRRGVLELQPSRAGSTPACSETGASPP